MSRFVCIQCGGATYFPDATAPLSNWSTAALMHELARREKGGSLHRRSAIVPCDECVHFKFWTGPGGLPDGHNCCQKGHTMLFRSPRSMQDIDEKVWGFFRPGCKDRNRVDAPEG